MDERSPTGVLDPARVAVLGLCAACGAPLDEPERCGACGAEVPDPRIGLVLCDRYRIELRIGAGGMGRVYRAVHVELGEPVAIKFTLSHLARDAEIRARFRREAVALARLRHPGIVSVLDFGEHEGELFMVMELVRGSSLDAFLAPGSPPMPLSRLGGIFDQVLQVLEAAHGEGIVHRDLKPENVMLLDAGDRMDRVKVLDFGLVQMEEEEPGGRRLTETGSVHGTPQYMSPEQCRGERVGPPTDIYAVGVMLYEALAGERPFEGPLAGIMAQQMFVEPPPIAERGGREVPPGLEAVVRSAMAKRAQDRPAAAALRDALTSAIRGTDQASMAARSAQERSRVAALSRSERAFTGVAAREAPAEAALAPALPAEAASAAPAVRAKVALWMSEDDRGRALRDALAVHGMAPSFWTEAGPPPAVLRGQTVQAVVLLDGGADERTLRLRSAASAVAGDGDPERAARLRSAASAVAALPILVVDVPDGARMAALIRTGASDVALGRVGDDDICKKVSRLVRRGR